MFIIAEIGQAHEGSLGLAHSFIDAIARTGADAAKFQVHIAEAESSPFEEFRINFSYEDKTRYDYWKRMEFTPEQWMGLAKHCAEVGVEFMASPFSVAAVELLEQVGVKRYKIGSGEINNFLLLEKVARTKKPVIVSSGMSNYTELDECIAFLSTFGNGLALLQCNTAYPTPVEQIGLNQISLLKERYKIPIGISDHSGRPYPCMAAAALGATMFEVHVVFDRQQFGPDTPASLTMDELTDMVEGVRYIANCLDHPVDKNDIKRFEKLKLLFGKSLAVNQRLTAGTTLTIDHLESKKPAGRGIDAKKFREVLGKKLKRNLTQWDFLTDEDLQ